MKIHFTLSHELITLSDVSFMGIMCQRNRSNYRPRSICAALNAATQIPNHIIQGCISGMSQPFNLTIRVIYLCLVIGKMCQVMTEHKYIAFFISAII